MLHIKQVYEEHPMLCLIFVGISILILAALIWYRAAINQQLSQLQESKFFGSDPLVMQRIPIDNTNQYRQADTKIVLVQICPNFRAKHKDKYQLCSLGEYMASLRPVVKKQTAAKDEALPDWLAKELQATLAMGLLKGLGPNFGAAVLPAAFGLRVLDQATQSIAQHLAHSLTTSSTLYKASSGGVPLSLFALTYVAELNYQRTKYKIGLPKREKSVDESESSDETTDHASIDSDNNTTGATLMSQEKEKDSSSPPELSPLGRLAQGEVNYDPSFNTAKIVTPTDGNTSNNDDDNAGNKSSDKTVHKIDNKSAMVDGEPLVPHTFILSQHWQHAIDGMENLMRRPKEKAEKLQHCEEPKTASNGNSEEHYNPHAKNMAEPKPINPRLLPGLHLGFGGPANVCTHTQRQILQNRLLSVLLNKLAANYIPYINEIDSEQKQTHQQQETFVVKVDENGPELTKPDQLIQALIDMGHSVESYVCSHVTTFGIGLSIKEDDGSWSNIPLAFFLQSGFTDNAGNDAYTMLPHGGLNLEIRGPLLEQGSLQHYMSIEGVCSWHSNHNPDIPWFNLKKCGPLYKDAEVVRSIRVAALEAIIINGVATSLELPFGGYGLTSVCNDSAALIEYAMTGETHVYPITFGRFSMQNLRFAKEFRDRLKTKDGYKDEIEDLTALIKAMKEVPSDLTAMPGKAEDQIDRFLYLLGSEGPFAIMHDAKRIIEGVKESLQKE